MGIRDYRRTGSVLIIACAAGVALGAATVARAQPFFSSFEGINDTDGSFVLSGGDPPVELTFLNGEARTEGNFDLYHTGTASFMVDSGNTGIIDIDPPVATLDLWLRDEPGTGAASIQTVRDENGDVIDVHAGSQADWTNILVAVAPGAPLIQSVELENTGGDGYAVIDDLAVTAQASGLVDPIPDPIELGRVAIRLETVATGLTSPNWGVAAPGIDGYLFVTDQDGILWKIDLDTSAKQVFLDLSARLVELGAFGPGTFDERGLLGVAFHPEYAMNGLFYTYTSEAADRAPDFPVPLGALADHHSVVTEWEVPDPANPASVADPGSARELLRIGQPQFNHNGGAIAFGPDRRLYIALGDGGSADDQGDGHVDGGNGQDSQSLLGAILRINPRGENAANGRYGIPGDNPFVGDPSALDEIFAYGFRNPFRMSFDGVTGRLWAADVGQNDIEEVDVVRRGRNYGWPHKEGSFFFDSNGDGPGFVTDIDPGAPPGLSDPVLQYDHDEGIAIIGGFVYRGSAIPDLQGRYVFGDFSLNFLGNDGRLFFHRGHAVREFRLPGPAGFGMSLLGFAQDASGELYVLANTTGVPFGDTGVVLKITPATPRP